MPRHYRHYIKDMIESLERIAEIQGQTTLDALKSDWIKVDALLRRLYLLGEGAKCLPLELRSRYPQVDWRAMIRLRDLLAHGYFKVNVEVIWDSAREHCTSLPPILLAMLDEAASDG